MFCFFSVFVIFRKKTLLCKTLENFNYKLQQFQANILKNNLIVVIVFAVYFYFSKITI
jgi:hypothetical protein